MYKYIFKLVFLIFNFIYIIIFSSKYSKNRYIVGKLIFLVNIIIFLVRNVFYILVMEIG